MITEQLTAAGIKLNSWETLESVAKIIGFNANKNQYTNPNSDQYYFDPANGVVYVRYTTGYPEMYNGTLKDGYVVVKHAGKEYQLRLSSGGINTKLGKIHAAYSIDEICAIYN